MAGGQIEADSALDYIIIAAKVCYPDVLVTEKSWLIGKRLTPNCLQLLFAVSPLIVLGYILLSAFEPEELEKKKRTKKADFELEGHAE